MKPAKRIAAYLKQTGAKELTARQRRRVEQKAGKRAARMARQLALADEALSAVQEMSGAVELANEALAATGETSGDFGPVPMPCGTCGAINDEPCRRPSGRALKEPHKARE